MAGPAPPASASQDELNAILRDALPRQGAWSDEEYLWLTDRSRRLIEFTDGYVQELPWPIGRTRRSWRSSIGRSMPGSGRGAAWSCSRRCGCACARACSGNRTCVERVACGRRGGVPDRRYSFRAPLGQRCPGAGRARAGRSPATRGTPMPRGPAACTPRVPARVRSPAHRGRTAVRAEVEVGLAPHLVRSQLLLVAQQAHVSCLRLANSVPAGRLVFFPNT